MARATTKKWSHHVMETSDAMDIEPGVFRSRSPKRIASALKRSAERSHRRKSPPYRSAMSMLVFYINRGGKNLSAAQRATLEKAKDELRALFGKTDQKASERQEASKRVTAKRGTPRARPERTERQGTARSRKTVAASKTTRRTSSRIGASKT